MRPISYLIAALSLGITFGLAAEAQASGPKIVKPARGQEASRLDASERGKRQRPTFERLDKNGDGKIVASEVPERVWKHIVRADQNSDQAVTKAELETSMAKHRRQGKKGKKDRPSFEQIDKNGDGKIVASEVPARRWERLSRADTNGDNAVTKSEFDAARANRRGKGRK